MPVYKYRSFEKAKRALWNFHPDITYFEQVAELWDLADKISPISYPQGIFKYRSIEEANKQREEWEIAHAKNMLLERGLLSLTMPQKHPDEMG